jgi:hypothetical protein
MKLSNLLLSSSVMLVPLWAASDARPRVSMEVFHDTGARAALTRLNHRADEFKHSLDKALDNSVLNGTALEDRLNQWANLLDDEMDSANKEFTRASTSGDHPDVKAVERFGDRWGNAMMAATAINRAMIRRGFAPDAERLWTGIRFDLNSVAQAIGRPPLPDMTVVVFRPASPEMLSRSDVKAIMKDLQTTSGRFEDKTDHAWFAAMGPEERRVLQRWADDLKSATARMSDDYKDRDFPEFQFKLEECLMLASGLKRALMTNPTSAAPEMEWEQLRTQLNTLATRFGYPVLARNLRG